MPSVKWTQVFNGLENLKTARRNIYVLLPFNKNGHRRPLCYSFQCSSEFLEIKSAIYLRRSSRVLTVTITSSICANRATNMAIFDQLGSVKGTL